MFDLTKNSRKKSVKTTEKKEISPTEKEALLNGYIEVPYEQWTGIQPYQHIRYERKGGLFRKGGFIQSTWKSRTKDKSGNVYMKLSVRKNAGPKNVWILNLAEVIKIWKLVPVVPGTTDTPVQAPPQDLTKIIQDIETLKKEQRQIVAIIKRLHNIKH